MPSHDKMSLKAFWETLEQQLAGYSADELRAILRAMAQETLPAERRSFLDKLKLMAQAEVDMQEAVGQDDLLADIDDLVEEIKAAMENPPEWDYEDDWYGYGEYYDEADMEEAYHEFIEPLAALFERAQAVFEQGNFELAQQAYGKLFDVFSLEDEYGRGLSLTSLDDVDAGETTARYLRAVYETESPARRPRTLFEQMCQAPYIGRRPVMLDDIIGISTRPLPDSDRFFRDWIAFLRKQSGARADIWLREAIRLSQGTAGLAELARQQGKQRPRAYLDWFTALEQEGKHQEVLAEAQQALRLLDAQLPIRAAIADHLCAAAARLNDIPALRAGRWEAFIARPTLARLLDLRDAAPAAEQIPVMQQAAQYIREYLAHPPRRHENMPGEWQPDDLERPAQVDESLLAHAYLLSHNWDAAHQLVKGAEVLGWSSSNNPQGWIVSFFLALLSGRSPDTLPANLKLLWGMNLEISAGLGYWSSFRVIDADDYADEFTSQRKDESILTRLEKAYAGILAQAAPSQSQRDKFLEWCLKVSNQRLDAIVGNLHRKSYGKAAMLIAACAETLELLGDSQRADMLLEEARRRYPRHSAFQAEMNTALARMGRPQPRKRK